MKIHTIQTTYPERAREIEAHGLLQQPNFVKEKKVLIPPQKWERYNKNYSIFN